MNNRLHTLNQTIVLASLICSLATDIHASQAAAATLSIDTINGADELGRTPLWYAVHDNDETKIADLLNSDADVNEASSELSAIGYRLEANDKGQYLYRKQWETPHYDSSCSRHYSFIHPDNKKLYYVANGKISPLMIAAQNGFVPALTLLLTKKPNLDQTDTNGYKAIDYAAYHGQLQALQLLLGAGAQPVPLTPYYSNRKGLSTLDLAAQRNHCPIISSLIVTTRALEKDTALRTAFMFLSLDAAQILLDEGANVNVCYNGLGLRDTLVDLNLLTHFSELEITDELKEKNSAMKAFITTKAYGKWVGALINLLP